MPTGARLARTDDVDDISAITAAVWRERSDQGGWPVPPLASDLTEMAATWADAILRPPSPLHRLAVAVDDADRVCGYAAWAPSLDADAVPGDVALLAFEIPPPARSRGHGSRLMSAVADLSITQGGLVLSHWCLVDDERRRAFFVGSGWAPDSAWRDVEIDHETVVREVRLVTAIGGTSEGNGDDG